VSDIDSPVNSMPDDERLAPGRFHTRHFVLRRLRGQLERALHELPASGIERVLDYGCGTMPYQPVLAARWPGLRYHGADLAGNNLAHMTVDERGVIEAGAGSFDLVLSTQVLEHVGDPRHYLSEAHRVLRPGGYLLASTHGYWKFHPDPTDYWRWTGDGLRKLIADSGYVVQQTLGVGNLASAGVQLFQDATIGALPAPLRPAYALVSQRFARLVCRATGGDSEDEAIVFLVTARKL
jgi:SAM-dependent methyltransferase